MNTRIVFLVISIFSRWSLLFFRHFMVVGYFFAGVARITRNISVSLYFHYGIAPLRRNIVWYCGSCGNCAKFICVIIFLLRDCAFALQYCMILQELRELREIYLCPYIPIARLRHWAAIFYHIARIAGIRRNISVSLYFHCGIAPLSR